MFGQIRPRRWRQSVFLTLARRPADRRRGPRARTCIWPSTSLVNVSTTDPYGLNILLLISILHLPTFTTRYSLCSCPFNDFFLSCSFYYPFLPLQSVGGRPTPLECISHLPSFLKRERSARHYRDREALQDYIRPPKHQRIHVSISVNQLEDYGSFWIQEIYPLTLSRCAHSPLRVMICWICWIVPDRLF